MHRLEDLTPRGTHSSVQEYKTAARTPDGEDAEMRATRLGAERVRRHRARGGVQRDLDAQVEEERAALERKAANEAFEAERRAQWKSFAARSAVALQIRRAATMQMRRDRTTISWDEMPLLCRAAAGKFGFKRGMWNQRNSVRSHDFFEPLLRPEWWWPWQALPQPLTRAALDLGYDQISWQAESLLDVGDRYSPRFYDMGDVCGTCRRNKAPDCMCDNSDEDGLSVTSDSHLTSGHIMPDSPGDACLDTMDLLREPGRRSSCDGAYAAYRPRGGQCPLERVGQHSKMENFPPPYRTEWSHTIRAL